MFFDSWWQVLRVALAGGCAYGALVLALRISGNRTLAKLSAFDFVVTVALGSTLATIALSSDVAVLEGVTAFATLIVLQLAVAWLSTRWRLFRRTVRADPVAVVQGGVVLHDALQRERLTESDLRQALRGSGVGGFELVDTVVLETDGTLSVITSQQAGSRSALSDVEDGSRSQS